jgi:P pilus assembly chaperone PapD
MSPAPCTADGFSVNPIRLELRPSQNAASLTVTNYNTGALLMQVRVYRWDHKDRDDQLTEIAGRYAPIVTPPLFRLEAGGGSQVVRIGFLKSSPPPVEERRWRVIIEEVPTQAADAPPSSPPMSVAIHMRISLPLLQLPPTIHQDLQWTLIRSTPGWVKLTAANLGNITERLDEIRLGGGDGARATGPWYLFPGERRTFDLRPQMMPLAGDVELNVQGTPRPLTRELVLSAQ